MIDNVRRRTRRSTLKALRRARLDAGLTISELAQRARVSRDTISNAERGRHGLQAVTLSKIARALGRTPSELLAEEERLAPKVPHRSPVEPTLDDLLEAERREAGERYLRMPLDEFEDLRRAANEGELSGAELLSALTRQYNEAEAACKRFEEDPDVPEEEIEEARGLLREARKRWRVVMFDRAEETIALDEQRDPSVHKRIDVRTLPLNEAYEEVCGRLGVTA